MSALTRVVIHLGRNPDAGFPEGDRHQGYIIHAPVGVDGKLNADLWKAHKEHCKVVRYSSDDEKDADGLLVHKHDKWFIEYDEEREGPDEDLHRLGEHRLWVGDYVTIHEKNGKDLIYVVAETN